MSRIAVLVLPITAALALVPILLYGVQINNFMATPQAQAYLIILLLVGEIIAAFVIHWSENKDKAESEARNETKENAEKRRKRFQEHSDTLIKAVEDARKAQGLVWEGWQPFLQSFRYSKTLSEHLYTGHNDLFLRLECISNMKRKSVELRNEIDRYTSRRIREETRAQGFPDNPTHDQLSVHEDEIRMKIWDILINNSAPIRLEQREHDFYIVSPAFSNATRIINASDREFCERLVERFNGISTDDETLLAMGKRYVKMNETIDLNNKVLDKEITSLINAINLKTRMLGGACHDCLSNVFHDGKDIPRLQLLLSQLQ